VYNIMGGPQPFSVHLIRMTYAIFHMVGHLSEQFRAGKSTPNYDSSIKTAMASGSAVLRDRK